MIIGIRATLHETTEIRQHNWAPRSMLRSDNFRTSPDLHLVVCQNDVEENASARSACFGANGEHPKRACLIFGANGEHPKRADPAFQKKMRQRRSPTRSENHRDGRPQARPAPAVLPRCRLLQDELQHAAR